jgi:nucleobase:cation symporter-1, NCS1 family
VLSTVENITLCLLHLLAPRSAINLTDYYLIGRGKYDIPKLFAIDGRYGLVNWGTVFIYIASIALEMPFINSPLYAGPLVKHLGGADISWLVGLIAAGGCYYLDASLGRRGAITGTGAASGK